MREIRDRNLIEKWMEDCGVRKHFDTPGLEFRAVIYERGEMVLSPEAMMEDILFLADGTIYIYGIREDGTMRPITSIASRKGTALLGDMEFCKGTASPLCVEARTQTVFLVLSVSRYRALLEKDNTFLHLIMRSLAEKLEMFASMEATASDIEGRLMFYMRELCRGGELRGVEAAALHLRCSRRQLQRVLRKLMEEGKITKTGKGRYRLKE